MRVRLVIEEHGFAVHVQVFERRKVLGKPSSGNVGLTGNPPHETVQHVLVRDDLQRGATIHASERSARARPDHSRQRGVASDMIRMKVGGKPLPSQVWGASGPGCGRPSIQIVRSIS